MNRKKKRRMIKREYVKNTHIEQDTNVVKFDQIRHSVNETTDQIKVEFYGWNQESQCSAYECDRPKIYMQNDAYNTCKRYAKYVLYHEIGHALLHFPYVINLELFDYDLYHNEILYLISHMNDHVHDGLLLAKSKTEQICDESSIWKGNERSLIRERIKDIMFDFVIRNPDRYRTFATPYIYESRSNWVSMIVNEFEADIFAAVNLNQRNPMKNFNYAKRIYFKTDRQKICAKVNGEILNKIMHDPLVKERLWIYKTHIVPNTKRKK